MNAHQLRMLIRQSTGFFPKVTVWPDETGLTVSYGGRILADIETEAEANAFILTFCAVRDIFED